MSQDAKKEIPFFLMQVEHVWNSPMYSPICIYQERHS